MSKVIVIGSNSFSGSNFVDFLLENADYDVVGMSRSDESKDFYLPYKKKKNPRFKFQKMDLNKDMKKILEFCDKNEPEYIVNFASQSMVGKSWQFPEHWYRTNLLSTVTLTNNLRGRKYLKKYVHISTPEVYGNCSGSVKENNSFNPSTPYAASRAAADVFINLLVKTYNFPAVFTRAANVYGPGQQLYRIIPRSIVFIKNGRKIPLHGGGEAKRSFIHIRDVCDATVKIMEKAKPGEIYHLSTDKLVSIKDLVKMICEKMKVDYDSSIENVEARLGLDNAYILDSDKAIKEFGWKPKIELDDGIDETIKWIDKNWDSIKLESLSYIHKE